VTLMLSQGMCSRALTFEVKATLVGDLNEWVTITLDDDHASTADVKKEMGRVKGIRPAVQEIFRFDDAWTGTKASGGSGHSDEQEDAAFVDEGYVFEGPCSVMVLTNELYAVVLEGIPEDSTQHNKMGVYERMSNKEIHGRGVWQGCGGGNQFLFFNSSQTAWCVAARDCMEAGVASSGTIRLGAVTGALSIVSTAIHPDSITGGWQAFDNIARAYVEAPEVRARVCTSVEQHAVAQHLDQEQAQALVQAQQVPRLVLGGLANGERDSACMGVYHLMEGTVRNRRAVWQKQSRAGNEERQYIEGHLFLFSGGNGYWRISNRTGMEVGPCSYCSIFSAALTPDQHDASAVWQTFHRSGDFDPHPEMHIGVPQLDLPTQ
jgi:hypothetical protein